MRRFLRSNPFFYLTPFFVFFMGSLNSCGPQRIPAEVVAIHHLPPAKICSVTQPEMIIVDAGHGGKDTGALKKNVYEEKKLTLATAFLVSDYLKKLGYRTTMTRKEDVFVPLETRTEIANALDADLFLSIHFNYSTSQDVEGVEVYYYKEKQTTSSPRIVQSKALGHEVLQKIISQVGAESRGVRQANFAVVRETKMPAILIEAGFLSHPEEGKRIQTDKYLHQLAKSIASGVDNYLKLRKK